MNKSAKEMFKETILKQKKLQENYKKAKILRKQEYLIDLKDDLLYIQKEMCKSLEEGYVLFNISTKYNLKLAYKIFRNKEQYTFGDERYHYFHIFINKRGIYKLTKMIAKNDRKLKAINQQLKELGWLDE